MKRKSIIEQEVYGGTDQINQDFDKKPGMTSYAPTSNTSNKDSGGGTASTTPPPTEKKQNLSKYGMVIPIDLLDARNNKKCKVLFDARLYGDPNDESKQALIKTATVAKPGRYDIGDKIGYFPDGTYKIFTKDEQVKTGNWVCDALKEKKEEPKPAPPQPGEKRTSDQLSIIQYQVEKKGRSEACNDVDVPQFKDRCAPLGKIADGVYVQTDLSEVSPSYFKPGEKKLYTKRTGSQEVSSNTTDQKIAYYSKQGWLKSDEIDMGEVYKYLPHNLRELEPRIFQTDYFMYEKRDDVSCDTLIQRMNGPEGKIQFGTITKGDCRKAVDTFYSIYIQNCDMEPTLKEKYKRYIKQCRSNKNFGKRIDSVMNQLTNISKNDPNERKRSFSLAESVSLKESLHNKLKEIKKLKESVNTRKQSLKYSIHENLLNIKETRRIEKLEGEIMKNRIDFVVESFKKSNKIDQFLRDVIYEFNYMSKQNFGKTILTEETTGENLLNYLSKKVPNAQKMLVSKMTSDIAQKLDGDKDSWWVNNVVKVFNEDTDLSVEKLLDLDCDYVVSKFSKAFNRILKSKKSGSFMGEGDDLTSLMKDSLDYAIDNGFNSDFERKLQSKICPILDSYKSRIKDTEEMLNKKLVSQKPDLG